MASDTKNGDSSKSSKVKTNNKGKTYFGCECEVETRDMIDYLRVNKYRKVSRSQCFRMIVEDVYLEFKKKEQKTELDTSIGNVISDSEDGEDVGFNDGFLGN